MHPRFEFTAVKRFTKILIYYLMIQSGACDVISPENPIICHVGDEALFNWTTDDGRIIYSANWGIKNGNHPDSQFINTNVFTTVVNYNKNMDPKYRQRVYFVGNLTMGRAWFKLKNVSLNDELKYVANIRESKGGVLAYIVQLKVKKKANITGTTQVASTHITDATATSANITWTTQVASAQVTDATATSFKKNDSKDSVHFNALIISITVGGVAVVLLILISVHYKRRSRTVKRKRTTSSESGLIGVTLTSNANAPNNTIKLLNL